jgi:2-dehydropantoate 2-reductase
VKTYDTASILGEAKAHLGNAPILSLQNGLDIEDQVKGAMPDAQFIRGVTSQGAIFDSPGKIIHSGEGDTKIGELDGAISERVKNIADIFTRAGIETEVSGDITKEVWLKGIVNCVLNPITGLTGHRNGAIATDPELARLGERICHECAAAAQAHGIDISGEEAWAKTKWVAEQTLENRNSMLIDLEKGKRTEIESINGVFVELGQRYKIGTPLNETLYRLVKAREALKR